MSVFGSIVTVVGQNKKEAVENIHDDVAPDGCTYPSRGRRKRRPVDDEDGKGFAGLAAPLPQCRITSLAEKTCFLSHCRPFIEIGDNLHGRTWAQRRAQSPAPTIAPAEITDVFSIFKSTLGARQDRQQQQQQQQW